MLSWTTGIGNRTVRLAHPAPSLSLPAQVAGAGVEEQRTTDYRWHGLHRERDELVVIQHTLAGAGFLDLAGHRRRVEAGWTVVVPVPHDHVYGCLPDEPWRFCWVILTGREAVRAVRHLVERRGPLLCLSSEGAALSVLSQVCREAVGGGWPNPYLESAQAWSLVMALCADALDGADAAAPDPVRLAMAFARSHLSDPSLGVEAMARAAGLSRFYLAKLFARTTGQSPREWLGDVRLREAMALLRGGLEVAAAGQRCGFGDPSYFCRAFKQATGLTPGAYRAGEDPRSDGMPPAGNHPAPSEDAG